MHTRAPEVGPASTDLPAEESGALLVARGVSKRFGAVRALHRVDLTVRAGEIHSLMGENGAGKSTLIKCLTGVHRPDEGAISLAGMGISPDSPREAEALGISTVYQEINLIPHLSVGENICLGREPLKRFPFRRIDWRAVRRRADAALGRLGLALDPRRELGACSIAVQQLVAIARALDVDARVLILDEPTSSLDRGEVRELFGVLGRLRRQEMGILFITHFIEQVYAVSDRVTVLRDGRLIAERLTRDLPRQELVSLMVGREFQMLSAGAARAARPAAGVPDAPPLLRVRGLARRGALEHADLVIGAGEAVGLAGLLGSGRTETARLIFAADRPERGAVELDGRRLRARAPRRAIARGLALTPEDRKRDGVIPHLSVRENIELALQARRGLTLIRSAAHRRALAERYIRLLGIKAHSTETPVGTLSGGNQQKVLLARWLATDPRLLILDEPTRGIDVGAKAEILRLIDSLRERGMSILFISSELEEVVRTCRRVTVLRDRRTVAELAGEELTEDAVLAAIAEHDA